MTARTARLPKLPPLSRRSAAVSYEVDAIEPATMFEPCSRARIASFETAAEARGYADEQERLTGKPHTVGQYRNGTLLNGVQRGLPVKSKTRHCDGRRMEAR